MCKLYHLFGYDFWCLILLGSTQATLCMLEYSFSSGCFLLKLILSHSIAMSYSQNVLNQRTGFFSPQTASLFLVQSTLLSLVSLTLFITEYWLSLWISSWYFSDKKKYSFKLIAKIHQQEMMNIRPRNDFYTFTPSKCKGITFTLQNLNDME